MLTIKNPRKDVHNDTGYEYAGYKLVDGGLTTNDGSGKYDNSIQCQYYEWTWLDTQLGDKFMLFLNRKAEPQTNDKYHIRIFQSQKDTHIYENFIQKELLSDPEDFYVWMIRKIITNR